MARYIHKVSGARVQVRDDKVMDSSWELQGDRESRPEPAPSGGVPAGNASQADWADWVLGNVEGVDEDQVRAMSRNELREKFGPRPE